MVCAVTLFPLVFMFAVYVGFLIIEQAMFVGYSLLPPDAHQGFYAAGKLGQTLNLIHAARNGRNLLTTGLQRLCQERVERRAYRAWAIRA